MRSLVKKQLNEVQKNNLLSAFAVIVLGVLLLLGVQDVVCKIMGIIALVLGAFSVIMYVVDLAHNTRVPSQLVAGVAFIALGLILFLKSVLIMGIIDLFFAIILIMDGTVKLDTAVSLFSRKQKKLGFLVLAFSLAALVFGFLILLGILKNAIGYILVADGVLDVITILTVFYQPKTR